MKKGIKKIFTIILAACMIISATCITAIAAEARVAYVVCENCGEGARVTSYGYHCDYCGHDWYA